MGEMGELSSVNGRASSSATQQAQVVYNTEKAGSDRNLIKFVRNSREE